MDKYLGKRLDGRYEIHELIGVGGMANVYRCTDTVDDREVAVKILKDEYLNNEEFIRRFKNESKAIAMLSHPNIVKVYDVSFGDMIQYIVMEYIDGITLKEYIDQIRDLIDPEAGLGFGEIPYGARQVMYLCADISELTKDTGFVPQTDFRTGMTETIAWMKSEWRQHENN